MRHFLQELKDFTKKGDWVLLILCLLTSAFGCVAIASATSAEKFGSNAKYIIIQLAATGLGVLMYAIVSSIDIEAMSERRNLLVAFNVLLLLMLIPFGTDNNTGNKSWLDIPMMPVMIQPAEICKITYIIIMASVMMLSMTRGLCCDMLLRADMAASSMICSEPPAQRILCRTYCGTSSSESPWNS